MATAFQTAGPCDVWVNLTGDGSAGDGAWTLLGRTTSEDQFTIAINRMANDTKTVASGEAPEQSVQANQTASIAFVLAAWDQAVLDDLRTRVVNDTAGTDGGTATVGAVMVGGIGDQDPCTIGIRIVPRLDDRPWWQFDCCLLRGEPESIGRFGNQTLQIGIAATAIPYPATNLLYTKGTTPITP